MKKNVLIGFFLTCVLNLSGQFTNDWVDHSAGRSYLKIKIYREGVYRIDYGSMVTALQKLSPAVNVASIDPRSIQIFSRGKEQYIYVDGESDGVFDATDFIEFYGEKNSGWLDEQFYAAPSQHTNPYYSLYSDTSVYFLTWNPNGTASSFRMTTVPFTTPETVPLSHIIHEEIRVYSNQYHLGKGLGDGKVVSQYLGGKGWASDAFGYNSPTSSGQLTHTFSTRDVYTGAGASATLVTALAGYNLGAGNINNQNNAHHVRIQFGPSSTNLFNLTDKLFDSYEYLRDTSSLTLSTLGSATSVVKLLVDPTIAPFQTTTDRSVCPFISLRYSRQMVLTSAAPRYKFLVPESSSDVYFNATSWGSQTTTYLYDLSLNLRYQVQHNASTGTVRTNISAGPERYLYLCADASVRMVNVDSMVAVNGSGRFRNYENLTNDSAFVIIAHRKFISEATSYAAYRAQRFDTLVAFVDELQDQFAYGIPFHPMCVRGFAQYAFQEWSSPPSHILLMGKAVEEDYHRPVTGSTATVQSAKLARSQCLVPTIGQPGCDNLLTLGLGSDPWELSIPIGRIAALQAVEIDNYKSKMVAFENTQNDFPTSYTINNRQWQKRVLHFAGGLSASENSSLQGFLKSYENILEGEKFGGKVFLFSKSTVQTIQPLDLDTLRGLIKDGVSMMTFFSHATGNTFDISVDDPTLWDNSGRYPVVLANACFSGNIHKPYNGLYGLAEEYIFTPNLGAIAFLATVDYSFTSSLHNYSLVLHRKIGSTHYASTLGEQLQAACSEVCANAGTSDNDLIRVSTPLEMTLHGDPALRIYPHSKPELTINDPQWGAALSTIPSIVTTAVDSFDLRIKLSNLGHATEGDVSVTATRYMPDGSNPQIVSKTLPYVGYEQEVSLTFPTDAIHGLGDNRFEVNVDLPISNVAEFNEVSNNVVQSYIVSITSAEIEPVYPYNYGVVSSFNQRLKANTPVPMNPEGTYVFQLDTTDTYDSPAFKQQEVTQQGAVIEWDPQLAQGGFEDSTVFFWRVSNKLSPDKWKEFSFQVIEEHTGYGQDHFFQYKENGLDFIHYNRSERTFEFEQASRELSVNVLGNAPTTDNTLLFATEFMLDGQGMPFGDFGVAPGGELSIAIVVIDTENLMPWGGYGLWNGQLINEDRQFGNNNNYNINPQDKRDRVEYFFSFSINDPVQMAAMNNLVQNIVPDGYYILAYSLRSAAFQNANWLNYYSTFEAMGADSIRYISSHFPYIFFAKKGRPETAIEVLGKSLKDEIELHTVVESKIKTGEIRSPEYGRALRWDAFIAHAGLTESNGGDTWSFQAESKNQRDENALAADISGNGVQDLSTLIADSVKSVRSRLKVTDNVNGTPAQLQRWHFLGLPAPDAAINPLKGHTVMMREIRAGQPCHFGMAVENISESDFGSIRVHYWLSDGQGVRIEEQWKSYTDWKAGIVRFDSVIFQTKSLSGNYTLWMEVNPRDSNWHTEQYHFNNLAYFPLQILADKNNPLLDVTFDGIHILNGDIVSPSPEIVIELKDENKFILMTDTALFDVYLTDPQGMKSRIPFVRNGSEVMRFEPATNSRNKARVMYHPEVLSDGSYTLGVMGRDASGNQSGEEEYTIQFEVINKSMVTQVMNYPNPFSTSTRFVFTLTGSKIPEVFTIQILSVSGKVVREITRSELGDIHIGRNITSYAWDGTDEYGDRLANGLYLYRVITRIEGQQVERFATDADQYFTKEFGKMYLFR